MRTPLPALLLLASVLSADPSGAPREGWAVVDLAYLDQNNSSCVRSTAGFGASAGCWATPRWGWEASWLHARLENTGRSWSATEDHLGASLLYRPWGAQGAWVPYLRAGLGASRLEAPLSLSGSTSTRAAFAFGAGAQLRLGAAQLARVELRSLSVATSVRRQELQGLVSYGFRWGGSE